MMQRLQSNNSKLKQGTTVMVSADDYILYFYRAWQEDGYFYCQTELCCRDTCREMLDSLRADWFQACTRYPSLKRLADIGILDTDAMTDRPVLPADGSSNTDSVIADAGVSGCLVPENTIWKIAHDVAAGLAHIHSHGIVHNDIKPSNIFLVSHPVHGAICKIGDFGIAGEAGLVDDGQEGDTVYMAPELLSTGKKETSVDIFSLGLTIYDIAAGVDWEMPLEGPRWHELRSAGHTPALPEKRSSDLRALIQSMIDPNAKSRPNADQILSTPQILQAGQQADELLRDYVADIDQYDRMQDSRKALRRHDSDGFADQTPRNSVGRDIRTPCTTDVMPVPPMLFTPTPVTKSSK